MQVLLYVRRIPFYIIGALTSNPPSLPRWAAWLTFMIRIIVLIVIFRRNLAPYLLAKVSRHIRARSISLRSIRGLYVHRAGRTWKVNRVGWSLHPFSESRISVIIEGLQLEISRLNEAPSGANDGKSLHLETGRGMVFHNMYTILRTMKYGVWWLWWLLGSFSIVSRLQTGFSSFTITTMQLLFRYLTSLIKEIDFEVDSIVISSEDLFGSGLAINGLKFAAAIDLSEGILTTDVFEDSRSSYRKEHASKRSPRFVMRTTDRFWERVWGQIEVSVTLNLGVEEIIGFLAQKPTGVSYTKITPSHSNLERIAIGDRLHFVCFPGGLDASMSVQAIPRLQIVKPCSLVTSLKVPDVEIFADELRIFLQMYFQRRQQKRLGTLPRPSIVPNQSNIISPRSPIAAAFSHFAKGGSSFIYAVSPTPRSQNLRGPRAYLFTFKSADILLSSVRINQKQVLGSTDTVNAINYVLSLNDFAIRAGCSDGQSNLLHRKWLGTRDISEFDEFVYGFTCTSTQIEVNAIRQAAKTSSHNAFSLKMLRIDVITHRLPWFINSPFLHGDPNGPFIGGEILISSIRCSENLELLRSYLDNLVARDISSKPAPTNSSHLPSCIPRVDFRLSCNSISVLLRVAESDNSPAIRIHNQGSIAHFNMSFHHMKKQVLSDSTLSLHTDSEVFLQPILIHFSRASTLLHDFQFDGLNPVVSTDVIELSASSRSCCFFDDDSVVLEPKPPFIRATCVTDGFAIDLWNEEAISTVAQVLTFIRCDTGKKPAYQEPKGSMTIDLSIHFAIASLTVAVTSKDVNPDCDLDISRGLELRSGIALGCHFGRTHYIRQSRYARQLPDVPSRRLLGIPEDCLTDLGTFHGVKSDGNTLSFGCLIWQTVGNTAASTPYEYGASHHRRNGHQAALIYVPRAVFTMTTYRQGSLKNDSDQKLDLTAHIHFVHSRLDLINVYSALLAMQTFRTLMSTSSQSEHRGLKKSCLGLQISFHLNNLHVDCQLPLRERMFIQVISLSMEYLVDTIFKTDCRSLVAYVPSLQSQFLWEELLRMRNLTVDLDKKSGKGLQIATDGLRLAIPYNYILSDLILDVVIITKAVKHLVKLIRLGYYEPVPSPPPEEAKQLSIPIELRIGILTLEATDSPFEAKLGLIWRTGSHAQKIRIERELAFEAKLRAVTAFSDGDDHEDTIPQSDLPHHFTSKRTTSIADARERLNMVHAMSWVSSFSRQKEVVAKKEDIIIQHLHKDDGTPEGPVPLPITVQIPEKVPPLFRAILNQLAMSFSKPTFVSGCPEFLQELGGLPLSTEYSLLVPLHLSFTVNAAMIMLRDYYLPILNIPTNNNQSSLDFETNLVIAEEMGPVESVQWFSCPIIPESTVIAGSRAFILDIPKTIMPVKSYADPKIRFQSAEFTWGVSYHPAIQDVMRVIETLTTPPQDVSPSIGFWDKLRLSFHWRIQAIFKEGARLHFKGSRDPYHVTGDGAGFDFHWDGDVLFQVGYPNAEQELIQLTSESMVVTIPDYNNSELDQSAFNSSAFPWSHAEYTPHMKKKVCARFSNGIQWGIGISLERTCDETCVMACKGDPFNRKCRFFTFKPHHEVKLCCPTGTKSSMDSYAGFRSNFIHFSTSLISPLRQATGMHNSFHLTPKTFSHFWSWWHLFDSTLSLPIRQGHLFPDTRPPTKKFGKHLATIKYRISFSSLYIAHVYPLDTAEAWAAGESHFVGVKAFLERFQADMHQREEESIVIKRSRNDSKTDRHKPFSSVDVVIAGLDLRALFGTFLEAGKTSFPLRDAPQESNHFWDELDKIPLTSVWVDAEDFVELDWIPRDKEPTLYMHQVASCPRLVYFKRTPLSENPAGDMGMTQTKSKFGEEDTHMCLMGKEPSAHEIQLGFAISRLNELRNILSNILIPKNHSLPTMNDPAATPEETDAQKANIVQMIGILERYVAHLSSLSAPLSSTSTSHSGKPLHDLYDMPANIALPEELGAFLNVYQVHCPKIYLNNATRDLLHRYYLASRARRGFEYHMAARAVRFIRDQALAVTAEDIKEDTAKPRQRAGSAQAAAQAVRRILTGEEKLRPDSEQHAKVHSSGLTEADPLYGWDHGVTERKAHLCLLLKPQVVLSTRNQPSILVLIADHVVLRNYGILDTANASDPVSGFIMQRNYTNIDSLQIFQPCIGASAEHLPLEVFVDFRCNSREFQRLVPQTHATLRYDKFNRLRLRNDLTTVALSSNTVCDQALVDHLQYETDLIRVDVPRFSFSADSSAFTVMGDIVTNLLLFSDPAHKTRMTQLETMLFSYDFTDLNSAAKVIADLQSRIRRLSRLEETYSFRRHKDDDPLQRNLLASKAHVFKLSEELNLIFDAIRLAQDSADDKKNEEKTSALRAEFFSTEISWLILDDVRDLLAKLAVRGIHFSWLSRKDGSTNSTLSLVDLQAFDGSPDALWPEILAKYDEPVTHRMIRRGLFVEAQWSMLAPVGGISIYDYFKVELHPIRLALETQLGNKLVNYFLPGQYGHEESLQKRHSEDEQGEKERMVDSKEKPNQPKFTLQRPDEHGRITLESPISTTYQSSLNRRENGARLKASRSFTNLGVTAVERELEDYPGLPRSISSTALVERELSIVYRDESISEHPFSLGMMQPKADGDAWEMRHRSAQKTFVHAEIPSIHVLLSVMKGRGFLIRDAKLRTYNLEWRNRTSSFEELFKQFIPSDPSLRGWVKIAWQQPIFSVGGVIKELITKTQWGRLGKNSDPLIRPAPPRRKSMGATVMPPPSKDLSSFPITEGHTFPVIFASDDVYEVEDTQQQQRSRNRVVSMFDRPRQRSVSRSRVKSLFKRSGSKNGGTSDISPQFSSSS